MTPAEVAVLCDRIATVLKTHPAVDHDGVRQALVAVLARWVAIAALQDGDPDVGRHFARATVELNLAAAGAFERMGSDWRGRN